MGITQQIVELAEQRAGGARIAAIVIEIGKLSCVSPDAVRFCFDLCTQGTLAEGAALVIHEPPGRARCRQCRAELSLDQPFGRCACGNSDLEWLSGEELNVTRIELLETAYQTTASSGDPLNV